VAGALPKSLPTVVRLDERDAAALADMLPGLPGADGATDPVTLAVDGGVTVRAGTDPDAVEVTLTHSAATGPAVAVPLFRADLRRMLALGCRTLRLADANKPVVGDGDRTTFAVMPLNEPCAVPPSDSATRLATDAVGRVGARSVAAEDEVSAPRPATIPFPSLTERPAMKHTNLTPAKPEPNGDALDPLAEAEGLRNALTDVMTRAARLVAVLKHMRREKRALSSVYQSLKDLNLGA
jgi:hypothetical protein